MVVLIVTALISEASAKPVVPPKASAVATSVAAVPIAKSSKVSKASAVYSAIASDPIRKPYFAYVHVQAEIVGRLGKKTLTAKSTNVAQLRQRYQVLRADYRTLRSDVVAAKFDVAKVGQSVRQYKQDFRTYVQAVKEPAERSEALKLEAATTQSTRYLVATVAQQPVNPGKVVAKSANTLRTAEAQTLAENIGASSLGMPSATNFKTTNLASLGPSNLGTKFAQQSYDSATGTLSAPSRSMASQTAENAIADFNGMNDLQTTPNAGSLAKADTAKTDAALEAGAAPGTEASADKKETNKTDTANADNKGLLDDRKLESEKKASCGYGLFDSKGNCVASSTLEQTGEAYKGLAKGYGCSASSGGSNLCDPALFPSATGDANCVSSGKTCAQTSSANPNFITGDYVTFLLNNKDTVLAKINNVRNACANQTSATCTDLLNRVANIEVGMGWNGQNYLPQQRPNQQIASVNSSKPAPTSLSSWVNAAGLNSSVYGTGSQ